MGKPILPPARRFAAEDRDLERRVRVLETRLSSASTGDADWTFPSILVTGWETGTNVHGDNVRYRKTGTGLVIFAGKLYNNTGSAQASTSAFFYLPAGYRPALVDDSTSGSALYFARFRVDGSAGSTYHPTIGISSDGAVKVVAGSVPNASSLGFWGITFYAEA